MANITRDEFKLEMPDDTTEYMFAMLKCLNSFRVFFNEAMDDTDDAEFGGNLYDAQEKVIDAYDAVCLALGISAEDDDEGNSPHEKPRPISGAN